jgi:hypothetical protein
MRWLGFLAVAVFAVSSADASAQTAKISARYFDDAGNPQLSGGPWPDYRVGRVVGWSVCPPDAASCIAAAPGASPWVLEAGPQPPGTTFEVEVEYAGQRTVDRSGPWGGTITFEARPELVGEAAAGARVSVTPARWTGGWGNERDELRVQACRTPAAEQCETLSAPGVRGVTAGVATIANRYIGWYLFAVDHRYSFDTPFPAVLALNPRDVPPLSPGPTIAFSEPVGPVVGPAVELRPRVLYRRGKPQLGTVRCPRSCRVQLAVVAQGTTYKRTMKARGKATIAPRLRKARPGTWRVTVRVDGRRLAARSVSVRP